MPLQKYTSIVAQGGGWHKKKPPRTARGFGSRRGRTLHRQPGDRTGFCQPDLDRIPHSGCGTVRDQGAGRLIDLLQIVVSIVFTRFMALFQHTITCQSVLLPARNTEQSEKWRTVGVGQLLSDRFLQSLQRFYLYKKEQRFFCRMAKTLLFFKC